MLHRLREDGDSKERQDCLTFSGAAVADEERDGGGDCECDNVSHAMCGSNTLGPDRAVEYEEIDGGMLEMGRLEGDSQQQRDDDCQHNPITLFWH